MLRHKLLLFALFTLICKCSCEQNLYLSGTETPASCYEGNWGIAGNPASFSNETEVFAGLAVNNKYFITDLNQAIIAVILPGNYGNWGLTVERKGSVYLFGYLTKLCYAKTLGPDLSAGIKLVYLYEGSTTESRTHTHGIDTELGFRYQIGHEFSVGSSLCYPFNQKHHALPASLTFGIGYMPGERLQFFIDIMKKESYPLHTACAVQLQINRVFDVYTTLSVQPFQMGFGVSVQFGKTRVGFINSLHYQLGSSPGIAISYQ